MAGEGDEGGRIHTVCVAWENPDPAVSLMSGGDCTLGKAAEKNNNTLGLNINKNRRSLMDHPVFVEY